MKIKIALFTILLVFILLLSAFVVFEASISTGETSVSPFYVGIEFGYGNVSDCKALIDKVQNYTNLLVISSGNITQSEALLNETCDYAYHAGMHLIVYFPQSDPIYNNNGGGSYHGYIWAMKAKEKYGSFFLGSYIYDETGGEVLDKAAGAVNINYVSSSNSGFNSGSLDYNTAANNFVANAGNQMDAYLYCAKKSGTSVMTADYGLYWFDYKAGYDTILAEFGWGNNRQMAVALCRGAAKVQNKEWGVIICWEERTNKTGHLESGPALYNDLVLAYNTGAKYAVIFDYAGNNQPNPYQYGILKEEHFDALKNFWRYIQEHPENYGSEKSRTALILPQSYGFGFRSPDDKIWGLDQADNWTLKMWNDVNDLLKLHGSSLDVVYGDSEFQNVIEKIYSEVVIWKSGATTEDYPVMNLNSTFGYKTIQSAISSGATYGGDTLYVKAGVYQENLAIGKPVILLGENPDFTIIDGNNKGSALRVIAPNVMVSNFTMRNGNPIDQISELNSTAALINQIAAMYGMDPKQVEESLLGIDPSMIPSLSDLTNTVSTQQCAGISLSNANNCSLLNNKIINSTYGIFLNTSGNVTLRQNILTHNKYGFGVSASVSTEYINNIDTSNTIDGKPIYYLANEKGRTVPIDAGYAALINCTDMTVENLTLTNNYNGLLIVDTNNSAIKNNMVTGNYEGLRILNSSRNVFRNNIINDNKFGFFSDYTFLNDIDPSNKMNEQPVYVWINQHGKSIPKNAGYVALIDCSDITIQNLNISNVEVGLLLQNTTSSLVEKNNLTNTDCAIKLISSSNNLINQNNIASSQDGIDIQEKSTNNTVAENNVAGNLYTAISIQSSESSKLQNNSLIKNQVAILITGSCSNTLTGNNLESNNYALQLASSQNYYSSSTESDCQHNTIIENNFLLNKVAISFSSNIANNTLYHNNFANNTQQAQSSSYSSAQMNIWDNGVQGNYWSNYNGTDVNGDGIGDQSFYVFQQNLTGGNPPRMPVASDQDCFPLMNPYS